MAYFTYTSKGDILYWSSNPLILAFDPNFQRDILAATQTWILGLFGGIWKTGIELRWVLLPPPSSPYFRTFHWMFSKAPLKRSHGIQQRPQGPGHWPSWGVGFARLVRWADRAWRRKERNASATWRINPVSKWLVTPIYKPIRPFGRGPTTLLRGLTNHGY